MVGQTISHYKITAKLGEGGMGIVYKAEDTKLKRPVALKFLRFDVLEDEEHKERFLREAQAAAALDHPNICTVYEIDEAGGQTFLSMAYLEGQTVKAKLKERPLKLDEALDIAIQTAQGLQAAHEKGVVHRDIKSANLMVSPRGQVKIMDFGLARLADRSQLTKDSSRLGTPAYMSPEQVRGEAADRRSDIWSLGVVIYEIITGRLPFAGEVEAALTYSILHAEPEPLTALRADVPIELDRIVEKALAKTVDERYPHAEDLLVDLRGLRKQSQPAGPSAAAPANRTGWYVAAAASVVAVAALAAVWLSLSAEPETSPGALLAPVPLTSYPGAETDPSFSPDGSQVAFSWVGDDGENQDIYLTMVDGGARSRLTENAAPDVGPAWSPDGSSIAFARIGEDIDGIYLVSPLGGRERKLTDVRANFAGRGIFSLLSWSPDGRTLAIPHRPSPGAPVRIDLLSIATGEMRPLTSPPAGFQGDYHVAFSPDGSSVAFVRISSYRASDVFLNALDASLPQRVTSLGWNIGGLAWSPSGTELLFSSQGPGPEVWRVSPEGGDPRPVEGLGQGVGSLAVAASSNRLAYALREEQDQDIWKISLGSPTTAPKPAELIASTRYDTHAQVSFDGDRIAFRSERSGYPEIWVADRDGSNAVKLTSFQASGGGTPRWSPDDQRIAFNSNAEGALNIYVMPAEGGPPQALTAGKSGDARPAWSPDGQWIYFRSNRGGSANVWRVSAEGGEPEQMTTEGGGNPKISPDGRHLYFTRPGTGSIWRMNIESGAMERFLDFEASLQGCYEPFEDGLYFLAQQEDDKILKRLDYTTGQITEVAVLERGIAPVNCFSLSPDRSWLVYTRVGPDEVDLMLVENFH